MSDGPDSTPAAGGAGEAEATAGTATATRTAVKETFTVSPSVYRRLMSGVPGFTVAMLACLVVVGLVLLLTPRNDPDTVPRVDYTGDLTGLRAVAPYTPQAPEGLPPQWYPTSSRLSGTSGGPVAWHLGFYTPQKQYAALEESDESPGGAGGFVDRMTSQGRPDGSTLIGGVTWDKTFRPDKKQRSLVHRLSGLTIVVTGTASYDELATLAGSLKAQPKPSQAATPAPVPS